MLEVTMFGQFAVRLNGEPVEINSRPLQLLFAYLMLNAGQTLPREKVGGVLWPDSGESAARKNLRNYVWRLRKAIGEAYLAADKNTLAFRTEAPYRFDVQVLAQEADEGSTDLLLEAVATYQGELLPGHYEDWIQLEREALRALFERRIKELLERLASEERWTEVVSWAEKWLSLGKTAEPAYRALMRGYAALGDLAGVATSYDRCQQALVEELGVEPSRETQDLFERLSAGKEPRWESGPGRDARPPSPDTRPPCPYRGLFAFREEDAPYFFGRELFTKQLVEAVQDRPLVAVVGPSGSGKSSVIFAGLLACLRPESYWTIVTFRPTGEPFSALAAALLPHVEPDSGRTSLAGAARRLAQQLRSGERTLVDLVPRILEKNGQSDRLLLVVDQFEELYTLCPEPKILHQFLDLLLTPITFQHFHREPTFAFLFTLRADFLEQALAHRLLADTIQQGTQMLGPMIRGELRRAIVEPAKKLDITFESGLVERILDDVGEEPGNLPLLEFALTTLWAEQRDGMLTHNGYEANDRIEGALTRHADQTLAKLEPAERAAARRILVQLIRPGEGTEDTRRVAYRDEFDSFDWAVAQRLADARLVITSRNAMGKETVEIVHEALIRNWAQLREWMDVDRAFRVWQERLRGSVNHWLATGEDAGALLRDLPLAEAEQWLARRGEDLSQTEQEYIRASVTRRDRERDQRREEQLAREHFRQRVTFGAMAGLLIALSLAALAGFLWQQATRERQVAVEAQATAAAGRDQARLALSRQLAALARTRLEDELDVALLLSLEATQIADSAAARSALRAALSAHPRLLTHLWGHTDRISSVRFSPDGKTLASAGNDNTIRIWDVAGAQPLGPALLGHTDNVLSIAFSPDGRTLASAGSDRTILLWDLTGDPSLTARLTGHTASVRSLAFSPDGQTLASSGSRSILLWDMATVLDGSPSSVPQPALRLRGHEDIITSVAFSPDGQVLASGSNDRTIILWDAVSGEALGPPLSGHDGWVRSVAFTPDNETLASAAEDGTIILWDLSADPTLQQTLQGHTSSVRSLAFSSQPHPDSGRPLLASGSTDETIILWDTTAGEPLIPPLTGHDDWVRSVAFSPDGETLVSAGHDLAILLWDVAGPETDALLLGNPLDAKVESVHSIAFSPDGQMLASGNDDQTITLWDVARRQPLAPPLKGHTESVRSVAFSPDGKMLASGSDDQTIIFWDVARREQLGAPLKGHTESVTSVAFSPDGQMLASGSNDRTIILWDVDGALDDGTAATARPGHPFDGRLGGVQDVTFGPEGLFLAAAGEAKRVRIWDMAALDTGVGDGPPLFATFDGHKDVVFGVDVSPNGTTLASGSWDKTVRLWDVTSGERLGSPLRGHAESVQDVAFSPHDRLLASGSWDDTIRLWFLPEGEALGPPLSGHEGSVRGLAFSPDGHTLASAGDDGLILLWDVVPGSWQARACRRVNRNLSRAEWQEFFGEQPYRVTCPELPEVGE